MKRRYSVNDEDHVRPNNWDERTFDEEWGSEGDGEFGVGDNILEIDEEEE